MNDGECSGEHVEIVEEEEGRLSLNDLPDDLLVLIFNRLLDLKCLFLCSLVSPRFSSLVFQIHSVSFALPRRTTATTTDATNNLAIKTLRCFVGGIVTKPLQYFRQFLAPKPLLSKGLSFNFDPKSVSFLREFKYIRYLHLVFPTYRNPNDDSLFFKWTAKFGASIDTFIFLSTSSIRAGTEFDSVEHEQEPEDPLLPVLSMKYRVAFECFGEACIRHLMLHFFIREHPLLQNIIVTDSKNQGSLYVRDSKVVEMRNLMLNRTPSVPVKVHQWNVPVLKLPVSSKVMVSATLLLMETVAHPNQGSRDWGDDASEISSLLFEQGEDEFAEAIVEMMVTHKNRITTLV